MRTRVARPSAMRMACGEVGEGVADDGLEGDGDAEGVELGGEEEGVGVLAEGGQHLGADGDDFGDDGFSEYGSVGHGTVLDARGTARAHGVWERVAEGG